MPLPGRDPLPPPNPHFGPHCQTIQVMSTDKQTAVARLTAFLRERYSGLAPTEREQFEQRFKEGHEHLLSIRDGDFDAAGVAPSDALLAYSLIHDDPDELLSLIGARPPFVDGNGQVYFAGVDYDMTDPLWAYTLFAWWTTSEPKGGLPNNPPPISIPDDATISLLGDWGGNNRGSHEVAGIVDTDTYVIHLGDVYYAGTNQSGFIEREYEQENFLDLWPGKAGLSFALNSNHDMYAHGEGLFETALSAPAFQAQAGHSYFCLQNSAFRIVAIDSAWYGAEKGFFGLSDGTLGPSGKGSQVEYLTKQAEAAATSGQTLILLSHHTGLTVDGGKSTALWDEVLSCLTALNGKEVIWYWGHEHVGAVYSKRTASNGVTVRPRCCGHSCIPWGLAKNLDNDDVEWFEHTVIGPGEDYFVANGYAKLVFEGGTLEESFIRQGGKESWPKPS